MNQFHIRIAEGFNTFIKIQLRFLRGKSFRGSTSLFTRQFDNVEDTFDHVKNLVLSEAPRLHAVFLESLEFIKDSMLRTKTLKIISLHFFLLRRLVIGLKMYYIQLFTALKNEIVEFQDKCNENMNNGLFKRSSLSYNYTDMCQSDISSVPYMLVRIVRVYLTFYQQFKKLCKEQLSLNSEVLKAMDNLLFEGELFACILTLYGSLERKMEYENTLLDAHRKEFDKIVLRKYNTDVSLEKNTELSFPSYSSFKKSAEHYFTISNLFAITEEELNIALEDIFRFLFNNVLQTSRTVADEILFDYVFLNFKLFVNCYQTFQSPSSLDTLLPSIFTINAFREINNSEKTVKLKDWLEKIEENDLLPIWFPFHDSMWFDEDVFERIIIQLYINHGSEKVSKSQFGKILSNLFIDMFSSSIQTSFSSIVYVCFKLIFVGHHNFYMQVSKFISDNIIVCSRFIEKHLFSHMKKAEKLRKKFFNAKMELRTVNRGIFLSSIREPVFEDTKLVSYVRSSFGYLVSILDQLRMCISDLCNYNILALEFINADFRCEEFITEFKTFATDNYNNIFNFLKRFNKFVSILHMPVFASETKDHIKHLSKLWSESKSTCSWRHQPNCPICSYINIFASFCVTLEEIIQLEPMEQTQELYLHHSICVLLDLKCQGSHLTCVKLFCIYFYDKAMLTETIEWFEKERALSNECHILEETLCSIHLPLYTISDKLYLLNPHHIFDFCKEFSSRAQVLNDEFLSFQSKVTSPILQSYIALNFNGTLLHRIYARVELLQRFIGSLILFKSIQDYIVMYYQYITATKFFMDYSIDPELFQQLQEEIDAWNRYIAKCIMTVHETFEIFHGSSQMHLEMFEINYLYILRSMNPKGTVTLMNILGKWDGFEYEQNFVMHKSFEEWSSDLSLYIEKCLSVIHPLSAQFKIIHLFRNRDALLIYSSLVYGLTLQKCLLSTYINQHFILGRFAPEIHHFKTSRNTINGCYNISGELLKFTKPVSDFVHFNVDNPQSSLSLHEKLLSNINDSMLDCYRSLSSIDVTNLHYHYISGDFKHIPSLLVFYKIFVYATNIFETVEQFINTDRTMFESIITEFIVLFQDLYENFVHSIFLHISTAVGQSDVYHCLRVIVFALLMQIEFAKLCIQADNDEDLEKVMQSGIFCYDCFAKNNSNIYIRPEISDLFTTTGECESIYVSCGRLVYVQSKLDFVPPFHSSHCFHTIPMAQDTRILKELCTCQSCDDFFLALSGNSITHQLSTLQFFSFIIGKRNIIMELRSDTSFINFCNSIVFALKSDCMLFITTFDNGFQQKHEQFLIELVHNLRKCIATNNHQVKVPTFPHIFDSKHVADDDPCHIQFSETSAIVFVTHPIHSITRYLPFSSTVRIIHWNASVDVFRTKLVFAFVGFETLDNICFILTQYIKSFRDIFNISLPLFFHQAISMLYVELHHAHSKNEDALYDRLQLLSSVLYFICKLFVNSTHYPMFHMDTTNGEFEKHTDINVFNTFHESFFKSIPIVDISIFSKIFPVFTPVHDSLKDLKHGVLYEIDVKIKEFLLSKFNIDFFFEHYVALIREMFLMSFFMPVLFFFVNNSCFNVETLNIIEELYSHYLPSATICFDIKDINDPDFPTNYMNKCDSMPLYLIMYDQMFFANRLSNSSGSLFSGSANNSVGTFVSASVTSGGRFSYLTRGYGQKPAVFLVESREPVETRLIQHKFIEKHDVHHINGDTYRGPIKLLPGIFINELSNLETNIKSLLNTMHMFFDNALSQEMYSKVERVLLDSLTVLNESSNAPVDGTVLRRIVFRNRIHLSLDTFFYFLCGVLTTFFKQRTSENNVLDLFFNNALMLALFVMLDQDFSIGVERIHALLNVHFEKSLTNIVLNSVIYEYYLSCSTGFFVSSTPICLEILAVEVNNMPLYDLFLINPCMLFIEWYLRCIFFGAEHAFGKYVHCELSIQSPLKPNSIIDLLLRKDQTSHPMYSLNISEVQKQHFLQDDFCFDENHILFVNSSSCQFSSLYRNRCIIIKIDKLLRKDYVTAFMTTILDKRYILQKSPITKHVISFFSYAIIQLYKASVKVGVDLLVHFFISLEKMLNSKLPNYNCLRIFHTCLVFELWNFPFRDDVIEDAIEHSPICLGDEFMICINIDVNSNFDDKSDRNNSVISLSDFSAYCERLGGIFKSLKNSNNNFPKELYRSLFAYEYGINKHPFVVVMTESENSSSLNSHSIVLLPILLHSLTILQYDRLVYDFSIDLNTYPFPNKNDPSANPIAIIILQDCFLKLLDDMSSSSKLLNFVQNKGSDKKFRFFIICNNIDLFSQHLVRHNDYFVQFFYDDVFSFREHDLTFDGSNFNDAVMFSGESLLNQNLEFFKNFALETKSDPIKIMSQTIRIFEQMIELNAINCTNPLKITDFVQYYSENEFDDMPFKKFKSKLVNFWSTRLTNSMNGINVEEDDMLFAKEINKVSYNYAHQQVFNQFNNLGPTIFSQNRLFYPADRMVGCCAATPDIITHITSVYKDLKQFLTFIITFEEYLLKLIDENEEKSETFELEKSVIQQIINEKVLCDRAKSKDVFNQLVGLEGQYSKEKKKQQKIIVIRKQLQQIKDTFIKFIPIIDLSIEEISIMTFLFVLSEFIVCSTSIYVNVHDVLYEKLEKIIKFDTSFDFYKCMDVILDMLVPMTNKHHFYADSHIKRKAFAIFTFSQFSLLCTYNIPSVILDTIKHVYSFDIVVLKNGSLHENMRFISEAMYFVELKSIDDCDYFLPLIEALIACKNNSMYKEVVYNDRILKIAHDTRVIIVIKNSSLVDQLSSHFIHFTEFFCTLPITTHIHSVQHTFIDSEPISKFSFVDLVRFFNTNKQFLNYVYETKKDPACLNVISRLHRKMIEAGMFSNIVSSDVGDTSMFNALATSIVGIAHSLERMRIQFLPNMSCFNTNTIDDHLLITKKILADEKLGSGSLTTTTVFSRLYHYILCQFLSVPHDFRLLSCLYFCLQNALSDASFDNGPILALLNDESVQCGSLEFTSSLKDFPSSTYIGYNKPCISAIIKLFHYLVSDAQLFKYILNEKSTDLVTSHLVAFIHDNYDSFFRYDSFVSVMKSRSCDLLDNFHNYTHEYIFWIIILSPLSNPRYVSPCSNVIFAWLTVEYLQKSVSPNLCTAIFSGIRPSFEVVLRSLEEGFLGEIVIAATDGYSVPTFSLIILLQLKEQRVYIGFLSDSFMMFELDCFTKYSQVIIQVTSLEQIDLLYTLLEYYNTLPTGKAKLLITIPMNWCLSIANTALNVYPFLYLNTYSNRDFRQSHITFMELSCYMVESLETITIPISRLLQCLSCFFFIVVTNYTFCVGINWTHVISLVRYIVACFVELNPRVSSVRIMRHVSTVCSIIFKMFEKVPINMCFTLYKRCIDFAFGAQRFFVKNCPLFNIKDTNLLINTLMEKLPFFVSPTSMDILSSSPNANEGCYIPGPYPVISSFFSLRNSLQLCSQKGYFIHHERYSDVTLSPHSLFHMVRQSVMNLNFMCMKKFLGDEKVFKNVPEKSSALVSFISRTTVANNIIKTLPMWDNSVFCFSFEDLLQFKGMYRGFLTRYYEVLMNHNIPQQQTPIPHSFGRFISSNMIFKHDLNFEPLSIMLFSTSFDQFKFLSFLLNFLKIKQDKQSSTIVEYKPYCMFYSSLLSPMQFHGISLNSSHKFSPTTNPQRYNFKLDYKSNSSLNSVSEVPPFTFYPVERTLHSDFTPRKVHSMTLPVNQNNAIVKYESRGAFFENFTTENQVISFLRWICHEISKSL
ncbi:hypothetical protein PCE1_000029 [Barthelona sp. PCE]